MRCRSAAPLCLALGLTLAGVRPAPAAPFAYHDYDGMVAELQAFAAAYPDLAEHFTAQDRFGLPAVPDGANSLEHHVLRITNEALGFDKPEVLLVGAQHGNEVVGLEVCLETARLLLDSYGVDPWLTDLVDRREIYMMPLANPRGFNHGVRNSPGDEGSEDMNRDHVYDRCSFSCADDFSLSTVGARALHELSRRHLFRVVLDLHGGVEMILHPWGSPLHSSDPESPDHRAATLLGKRMSDFGGPFSGHYLVNTATAELGPVHGPLDDTSYAAGWDGGNADPTWPTDDAMRAVTYTVEISNQKKPPVATLGGDAAILVPGGAEDGYVPKNVRGALAAIDAAEPYVVWTNRAEIPATVAPGQVLGVEWQVRGCFEVDDTRVRSGTDPDPLAVFSDQTASQAQTSGDPCFDPPATFSAEVSFAAVGVHYLTPVARVDSTLLVQGTPDPALPPQTWLVRARTDGGFFFQNEVDPNEINTVQGRLYRGAQPLAVEVPAEIFTDGFESGDTSSWSSGR